MGGYSARIAGDQFDRTKEQPGFAAELAIKDVGHIRDLAAASKVIETSMMRCHLLQG